jgi:hypothetical protein
MLNTLHGQSVLSIGSRLRGSDGLSAGGGNNVNLRASGSDPSQLTSAYHCLAPMCASTQNENPVGGIISYIERQREWSFNHDFAPQSPLAKSTTQQKYYEIAFQLLGNSIYSFH